MTRWKQPVPLVVLALLGALIATGKAGPDSIECTGMLTGIVDGNVVVPPFSGCILSGAAVGGSVRVEEGSDLGVYFSTTDG